MWSNQVKISIARKLILASLFLVYFSSANADLTDGLVAYYCFDDATNIGKDCSTNGNNGSPQGSVISATGYKGMAAKFGGSSSPASIHVPNSSTLQFTSSLSISYAMNLDSLYGMRGNTTASSQAILAKSHDRTGFIIHTINYDNKTGIYPIFGNNVVATPTAAVGNVQFNTDVGKWMHVVFTLDAVNGVGKAYHDGKLVKTENVNLDFNIANTQDLYIGKFSDYWYPFNGSIDEVRIYNRALTPTEVTALYQQGATPAPILTSSPQTLNFPEQTVGAQSAGQLFTLSNTGTGDLKIGETSFTGVAAADYVLLDNTCTNQTLPPLAACTLEVAFKPSASGLRSAEMIVASNAKDSPAKMALSGMALAVDLALILENPPPRLLPVQAKYSYTFQVKNVGQLAATNVQVVSILPKGTKFAGKKASRCKAIAKQQAVVCQLGNLEADAKQTVSIDMQLPSKEARVSQHFAATSGDEELATLADNNHLNTVSQTYFAKTEWGFQAQRLAQQDPKTHPKQCLFKPGDPATKTTGGEGLDGQETVLAKQMPIDYVFVLMLENRSFDSYFGRFPAYLKAVLGKTEQNDPRVKPFVDDLLADGVDVPGTPYHLLTALEQNAADKDFSANANSRRNAPYNPSVASQAPTDASQKHYWMHHSLAKQAQNNRTGLCVSDTAHDWWAAHLQWNLGAMDGFYQANHNYWEGGEPNVGKTGFLLDGERAMLYYDDRDIPFYYWLADNFALGDRYFGSVLGPTWVNRDYLYAGTSRGLTSNNSDVFFNPPATNPIDSPYLYGENQVANPAPVKFKGKPMNYIVDALVANKWGVEYWVNDNGYLDGDANPPRIGAWIQANALYSGKRFADFDAALLNEAAEFTKNSKKRKLHSSIPAVNFIDPKQLEDVYGEDEHPPGTPAMGQRFTYQVLNALVKNPEIWKRSVLFITYDEHGGFYDHVSPPPACEPDNKLPRFAGRYGGSEHALRQQCITESNAAITACDTWVNTDPTLWRICINKAFANFPNCNSDNAGNRDGADISYGGAFNRYGVRVPVMVVSPWAKPHFVSHQTYDHTSILRFIEGRFGLPALTRRDANADPMLDFFDFTDKDKKLNGKDEYRGWGKVSLPSAFPSQDGDVASSEILNPSIPSVCEAWFAHNNGDSDVLGDNTYPIRDWSDGISAPESYFKNGVGIGEGDIRR